jgi:hypothetical protein
MTPRHVSMLAVVLLAALLAPSVGRAAAPSAAPASAPAAPQPAARARPAPAAPTTRADVHPATQPAWPAARTTEPMLPTTQPAPSAAQPATPPATQPSGATTYRTRAGAVLVEEDGAARFSLPTESDREAWRRPGFRVALGLTFGELFGIGGAPNGRLLGPFVRFGVRLDRQWSLLGSLQFHYATAGVSGIRFAGTVEPTWHVTDRLSLSLGIGFGGIVESSTNRVDPSPLPSTLDTSYTFPNAKTPLPSCSGVGVAGLLRGEYLFVLGPRSSTGVAAELDAQWTGCVADTGRVEPDTAKAIVRRQWWPHVGFTISWVIAWR